MKTVLITGADRGIGFALCECFLKNGWTVMAGQYMPDWKELEKLKEIYQDRLFLIPLDVSDTESVRRAYVAVSEKIDVLDILVNNAGIIRDDSCESVLSTFNTNTLGPVRMVEIFLPLMEKGMKRLCFVSSEAGSITAAHRTSNFAYCMSKTALNMAVRLMFNSLRSRGYTFRLYHPGWVKSYMSGRKSEAGTYEPEETAASAFSQFIEDRDWEDALVLTDINNLSWPF